MKGLALETIILLIIGIAGLLILLGLYTGTFKPAANWFYCNVYYKLAPVFNPKITLPDFCKAEENLNVVEIKESSNKAFSRILLAYIIACWKEAELKGLDKSHPCYELRLLKEVDNVTEKNVTDVLIKEDHCSSIENSDYECGAQNNILWKVDGNVIKNQKIILIKYNSAEYGVEVIG